MAALTRPRLEAFSERFLFVVLAGKPMDTKLIEWLLQTETTAILLPQKYPVAGIC